MPNLVWLWYKTHNACIHTCVHSHTHTHTHAHTHNHTGAPSHPCLPSADPPTRPITYVPGPNEKLDPRAAIAGRAAPPDAHAQSSSTSDCNSHVGGSGNSEAGQGSSSWQSGLFDKGSWEESQASWARTVVSVFERVRVCLSG